MKKLFTRRNMVTRKLIGPFWSLQSLLLGVAIIKRSETQLVPAL